MKKQFKYEYKQKILKTMKILKESPKLSISIIITLILEVWTLINDNSELFGINGDTIAKISVIVSIISLVWNQLKPSESVFKMAYRHVGTRPTKPPKPQDPPKED